MRAVDWSIRNIGVVVAATTILLVMGAMAAIRLPISLLPTIEQPQITIQLAWRGASPSEVEAELLEPVEDAMAGIAGVRSQVSTAVPGGGNVELTFQPGVDMDTVLIDAVSRLASLPPLPVDAEQPRLQIGGADLANRTLLFVMVRLEEGQAGDVLDRLDLITGQVVPRIESVPGVATVEVGAGNLPERQIRVVVDPHKAAAQGVPLTRIVQALGRAENISGGQTEIGRRLFAVRYEGRYAPAELERLVIDWRNGAPVRLADVATVVSAFDDLASYGFQNGGPGLPMRIIREPGSDVLTTVERVKQAITDLNEGPLRQAGLRIHHNFDPSFYIHNAWNLLTGNLVLGIVLAVAGLWLFVRNGRATLLIALTIPVSLLATLLVLEALGRTINIISLAGLAFAVGMTLDAGIVLVEKILVLRAAGRSLPQAAGAAAVKVAPALVASTVTTVAVFLPVMLLDGIEGQIFGDLALSITLAVGFSLAAALLVLPAAATIVLRGRRGEGTEAPDRPEWTGWRRIAERLVAVTDGRGARVAVTMLLVGGALAGVWALMPSLNYLPPVERDSVDVNINLPPGTNPVTARDEIVTVINARMAPFLTGERQPHVRVFTTTAFPGGVAMTVRMHDPADLPEMLRIVRQEILVGFPEARPNANRGNLFAEYGASANIELHLQSTDGESLDEAARHGLDLVRTNLPGANVFVQPNAEAFVPELRLIPRDERILELGLTRQDVGPIVRALGDGLFVGQHFDGERRLDLILRGPAWTDEQQLGATPLAMPGGTVVTLRDLVEIRPVVSAAAIRRVDGRRTVTLTILPPPELPLETALETIRTTIEPELRAILPADGTIVYGGSADALDRTVATMAGNLAMALALLFLLMAAMFRSPWSAALVLLTLPAAALGGIAGVRLTDLVAPQSLDLLTMIGFVILLGVVVNNAILLVDETREARAQGLDRRDAVRTALALRLRPILATMVTTVVGMLPLLLIPGEGSVIYRGIAAVMVGGMVVGTAGTLLLVPALLRMGADRQSSAGASGDADRSAAPARVVAAE